MSAYFDDNPVERLRAFTKRLDGREDKTEDGKPYGSNLRCPLCQKMKDRTNIDIPTNKLKIAMGDLPNVLVVYCERVCHNQNALVRAVTKAADLSLGPRPSPMEIRDGLLYKVGKMRQTPAYRNLLPQAKALVDILVEAVLDGGLINGDILLSTKEWMSALGTRSAKQVCKAIARALDSGLIARRKTQAPTLEGGRPSFLYGLKCLPPQTTIAIRRQGNKPGNKPSKGGINPPNPIDIVESVPESYKDVPSYDSFPGLEAQASESEAGDGLSPIVKRRWPAEISLSHPGKEKLGKDHIDERHHLSMVLHR